LLIRNLFLAAAATLAVAGPAAAAFTSDRITVTVEGSGPDVILVPGLTSSPRIWAGTVAGVPGYRYHLVQVKGFAGTAPGANRSGDVAAPVASEIARYIAEAKLARPAVIGHSMGGTIGMMLAARHPDAVGKLMVVDMVPFLGSFFGGPGATVDSVRPIAMRMRADAAKKPADTREQERVAMIATMVQTEAARAGPSEDARTSDADVVANAYSELMLTDLRPELKAIKAPTTVLFVRPPALPITDAQMEGFYKLAFAGLPGVTLTRVPDAWHFIMLDQPARFQEDVKAFLAK
jgi:pimeloyl-ACP methyl ester carboxylesterase